MYCLLHRQTGKGCDKPLCTGKRLRGCLTEGREHASDESDAHQHCDPRGCSAHVCIGVPERLAYKVHELLQAEAVPLAHAKHWDQHLQQ